MKLNPLDLFFTKHKFASFKVYADYRPRVAIL